MAVLSQAGRPRPARRWECGCITRFVRRGGVHGWVSPGEVSVTFAHSRLSWAYRGARPVPAGGEDTCTSPVPRSSPNVTASGAGPGPDNSGLVLVLNAGSASVKFAVVEPGSGRRVLGGEAEEVGTREAVLHIQRDTGDPVTDQLTDGSHQA